MTVLRRLSRPWAVCLGMLLVLNVAPLRGQEPDDGITLEAGDLQIRIDATGHVRGILDLREQVEYFPAGESTPLLSIDLIEGHEAPTALTASPDGRRLRLEYAGIGATATIEVQTHPTHLALELKELSVTKIDKVQWGPFPTTIGETIGSIVGVVRNDRFAFGIQGLNLKTQAGAYAADFGSTLRARTADRTYERTGGIMDVRRFTVPPMSGPDALPVGSRIALFGCRADRALETIGRIEVAEGLPHPTLDGVWAKVSPKATLAYLIIPFNENNLDEVLAVAQQAGLTYIYHEDPFHSWGHFEISPAKGFPEGIESLRRCVERAEAVGIKVAVHTLSNFIQTHDPYVSPVPHPDLVRTGISRLSESIDATATTIPIDDPEPFRHRQWLSTAMVGQELIRYDAVSEQEPWRLIGCRRGSFGTEASAHAEGAEIGKLWDHPYQVFFPNLRLQDELAEHLVDLFNKAGLRQISFDGLEGCWVTGEGAYASDRFVKMCYDGWENEVISDSSQLTHFTWHIHTRMNWGEPWGAAMREGMPEYRFKNQDFFRSNLLPPMLGWFQIRVASPELEAISLDDVEWVLSKSAGFEAGCAWHTHLGALEVLGNRDAILDTIREWDRARHLGAFSAEQRARLREPGNDFHLEPVGDKSWRLTAMAFAPRFGFAEDRGKDGEHFVAVSEVTNRFADQPLQFIMRVLAEGDSPEDGAIINPTFEIDGRSVTFPLRVQARQYLVGTADGQGLLYDANWNLSGPAVKSENAMPTFPSGSRNVGFRCRATEGFKPQVEIRVKTVGPSESVSVEHAY